MSAPDFWDDAPAAQKVLKEIKILKSKSEKYEQVRNLSDDLFILIELYESDPNEENEKELTQDLNKLKKLSETFILDTLLTGNTMQTTPFSPFIQEREAPNHRIGRICFCACSALRRTNEVIKSQPSIIWKATLQASKALPFCLKESMPTAILKRKRVFTDWFEFLRSIRRVADIHLLLRWILPLKSMMKSKSKSILPIFESIRIVQAVPADSTLTKRNPPSESHISRQGLLWLAKTNEASIRTKKSQCVCSCPN